jgi:CRISPR-associated protein Cas1
MQTLYISRQGCYICLTGESLIVKQGKTIFGEVQLPLLEQVLIFGKSQITTAAMRACLQRNIPIAFLSRLGYCYGRLLPIERGYRHLARYQQQLSPGDRLLAARAIVSAKLKNSRTLLARSRRRHDIPLAQSAIDQLDYFRQQASRADTVERLLGLEGAAASQYFSALGECLAHPDFPLLARRRRPPGNPVNAMLSFGYQVLWNHLLTLVELQGLDPYQACLHQGSDRHAALASDLIEEFRAPIVDSLVLWLVNTGVMKARSDFEYRDSGCFLNDFGRPKYLKYFVQRMEEAIQTDAETPQPRWDLLVQQVKQFKAFVYQPALGYSPYQPR